MFLKPFYMKILSFSSLLILTTLVATPESWAGKDKDQKRRQTESGKTHDGKREKLISSTEDEPEPMAVEADDDEQRKGQKRKSSPRDLSDLEPSLKHEKTEEDKEAIYVDVLIPPNHPLETPLTASMDEPEEEIDWPFTGLTEEQALVLMEKAGSGNVEAQDQLAQFVYAAISSGSTFFGEQEVDYLRNKVFISKWDNIDERILKDDKYRVLAILALSHVEGLELLEKSDLDPFIMGTLHENIEEGTESAFRFFQTSAHQGNLKGALKVIDQFLYAFEEQGGVELIPCVEFAKQRRNSVDVTYALGILYKRADRTAEAISCFEEIIQSNKSCRDTSRIYKAFYRLSEIWENKGEFEKAAFYLQTALSRIEDDEDSTAFHLSRTALKIGKLFERQEELDEAIEWYFKYHQKKDWRATHALLRLARTHPKVQEDVFKNPETYTYKEALKFLNPFSSTSIAKLFEEKGNMEIAIPFYISAFENLTDEDSAAPACKKLRELFFRGSLSVRTYVESNPPRAIKLADPSDPRAHELLLLAAPLLLPKHYVNNWELITAYMDDEGRYGIRKNPLEAARWILNSKTHLPFMNYDFLKTIFSPNLNPPELTVANPSFIVGETFFTQVAGHFARIATFLENPDFSLEIKEETCPPSLQPFYLSLNSFFNLYGETLRKVEHGSGLLINCIDLSPSAMPFYGTENPKFFVRTSFDRSCVYLSVGEENFQTAKQIVGLLSLTRTHNQFPDLHSITFSEYHQQALKSIASGLVPSGPLQRALTEEFKTPIITSCGDTRHLAIYLHQIYNDLMMRGKGYREGMETIVSLDEMTPLQRAQHQSTLKMEELIKPEIEILKTTLHCILRLPDELRNAIRIHVNSRNQRFLDEHPRLIHIVRPLPDIENGE